MATNSPTRCGWKIFSRPPAHSPAHEFLRILTMRKILLLPAALMLASGAGAANLQPMNATYSVVRDGKPIGDANYSLVANSDGTWTLRSETRGSAGMARLLGLDV